jgi:hypothetical protein
MIQSIERGGPALPLHVVLPHEGTLGSLRILAGAEPGRPRSVDVGPAASSTPQASRRWKGVRRDHTSVALDYRCAF